MSAAQTEWCTALIGRLASLLAPRHILLAGAGASAVCRALADAARGAGGLLHVAVREVPDWLQAMRTEYGDHLMIHAAPAADVAGVVPVPELAWVDEDPNWFSVHGVLEAMHGQAGRLGKPYPVTLVAGTGWPNGRRDSYADPAAIPEGFRHPHQRAGLLPGRAAPGAGGLFGARFHATAENEPRNGVLTAVEDVVTGRGDALRLVHLPGFGGLAAVCPRVGPGAEAFAPAALAADLTRLAAALETARLEGAVALLHAEEARVAAMALAPRAAAADDAAPMADTEGSGVTEAEAADLAALRGTPLFDAGWYLAANADVAQSGVDPALHYLRHGAAERRDPNAYFSSGYYLDSYPDVAALGLNPVLHYLSDGAAEGRNPGPRFATRLYVEAKGDALPGGVNPLVHFLTVGLPGGGRAPAVP